MYVCLYVAFVQRRRKHKIGKSEQMKRQISSFIDLKKEKEMIDTIRIIMIIIIFGDVGDLGIG
ncbi:unnamed protein product [Larinioides sclopetarius]|uniref:Uncharacterized protein n=1 Tax=Larinioides sclopetarius TaxID=280406 RepID=A0AAV2A5L9_9ARAC